MLWKRIHVGARERLLVARKGKFRGIFAPGDHWFFDVPFARLETERHYVRNLIFQSPWTNYLLQNRGDLVEQFFVVVRTNRVQVAMVYVDSMLFKVLPPAKRVLLWRGVAEIRTEVVEVIAEPATPFDNIRLPEFSNSR
ncbi:MAG: hypothetical protein JO061_07400 [Acidobacteriaceae bacterium]|nr:hypothetical protein [Acidobacteriaceae bacterium]